MSPSDTSSRRRSRSVKSDDEEEEEIPSRSNKRVRTNGNYSEAESNSSEPLPPRQKPVAPRNIRRDMDEEDEDEDARDFNTYQPGAIVRVKLYNFVTYENAEFFPGPSLNMVIGPNGTGKSSLVCALCLGLGWGPAVLARSAEFGSFVKNGTQFAEIEIELQKREKDPSNYVVCLRIVKDGNAREWSVGGKRCSLKVVQALTKSLSIQIDNLCQFLPQDKVASFAALSPVELLQRTQEAAAPPEMLEWHDTLKKLRKEQKELTGQHEVDQSHLDNLETRQQNLRAEVERLQERLAIEKRVKFLEFTMPLVEYNTAVALHRKQKAERKEAEIRLKQLKERIAPTLRSINKKKDYKDQVEAVMKERLATVKLAEREADEIVAKILDLETEIVSHDEQIKNEKKARVLLNKEMTGITNTIRTLQARMNDRPVHFEASEWNERARLKEQEARGHRNKAEDFKARFEEIKARGAEARAKIDEANQDLTRSKSQEGQMLRRLEMTSRDTARAWQWIQEHMSDFVEEVYAPPMISCSIKDPRFAGAVESMLQQGDLLAITAQTFTDMKKLSNHIHGTMGLTDVTLRTSQASLSSARPLSPDNLKAYGMDGWAIDFLDGPNAVLSMLCGSRHLDKTAVTLKDVGEAQYDMIINEGRLRNWVTSTHTYNVSVRAEYGPSARSTNTKKIRNAIVWVDQPVDTAAENEILSRKSDAEKEFEVLKQENNAIREDAAKTKRDLQAATAEVAKIKKEKAELQKADNEYKQIPIVIQRHEEKLEIKRQAVVEAKTNEKKAMDKYDLQILRKMKEVFKHKNAVSKIRLQHAELLDARIRLWEAESDIEGLENRNEDIVRQQSEEEERVRKITADAKRVYDQAVIKKKRCLELFDLDEVDHEMQEELQTYAAATNIEALENEIAAEQSKLDYIHADNPNAINQFATREAEVNSLRVKIEDSAKRLEKVARKITRTREQWEPQLDALISEISDAFSYNFEQIGCAGEVGVHKDQDFDLWSIEIRVKFREKETLQLLDQHRQSGGERSVSTIFYLMSLQALAQAPFRVVDEINQGMDPRNERMVHERMVDIACKEHTSQYFLITPKLLTGLRYHPRMKVLCIASGEHMPEDYKKLDINEIIGTQRAITAAA